MYVRTAMVCCLLLVLCGCKRGEDAPEPKPADTESVNTRYITLMNVGKAHYETGSATEALESFQAAVDLLPTEVAARLNVARACLLGSRFEETVEACTRAIELDRYATSARYLAGVAYLQLGRSAEAVAMLESAVRDDPSTAAVQFQFGAALLMDKQPDRAAEAFRAALQLNPNHWSAHFRLASIAQRAKDNETYYEHMREFQRLRQNMPDQQNAPDYWLRCKHTVAEVPTEVHQPDAEPIAVRFAQRPISVTGTNEPSMRPLACIDFDGDGRNDVLVLDRNGALHMLRNTRASFVISETPVATIGAGFDHAVCRVADFDNDGGLDLYVHDTVSAVLLERGADGTFADVTQAAGLNRTGALDAAWVDFDHEGDLDLLVVNSDNSLTLWQNNGNGTFVDVGASVGIPPEARGVRIAPADMDSDQQTDVVVTHPDGPAWQLHNDGLGEFEVVTPDPAWPSGSVLLVEDVDNDLARDVVVGRGTVVRIALSGGKRHEIELGGGTVVDVLQIDYDNDGWLDLLVQHEPTTGGGEFRLFRNIGAAGWIEVPQARVQCASEARGIVADLDADGDSDLLFNDPAGKLSIWSNDGGNANAQLKLTLTGTKSNKSAIGTLVEINAGSFRLSRTVTAFPVEIGVGDRKQLDSVRTIWPNGIVKHDIWVDPTAPLAIEEPFVSAGSCPYLYAWDGESFAFITDILGSSPLGLSLRRGTFVPADTDEFIWVGNDRTFPPRGGRYAIQITDELREVLYLDHLSLVAVDHPADRETHPTSKILPPPFVDAELWTLGDRRDVLHAVDNTGRDWTNELIGIDGRLTQPPALEKPQLRGRAPEHSLEIEFGDLDVSQPLALVLTGWLMWGDAGVNVSAAQNPDLGNPWPRLDAWTDGTWQPVAVEVGAPAGKTKSIIVDLAGRLPEGCTKLRLTTAFELYWDRIALFVRHAEDSQIVTRLTMRSADLYWRGFCAQIRPDPTHPVQPDTTDIRDTAPWRRALSGWCTRYGDISELLSEVDDRYAIFSGGDAAIVEFDDSLPALRRGWSRDFFIYCDGWDKDGDHNVAFGDTVEPLPFHGMDDQRYGQQEMPPGDTGWIERFNTRWVGP